MPGSRVLQPGDVGGQQPLGVFRRIADDSERGVALRRLADDGNDTLCLVAVSGGEGGTNEPRTKGPDAFAVPRTDSACAAASSSRPAARAIRACRTSAYPCSRGFAPIVSADLMDFTIAVASSIRRTSTSLAARRRRG